MPPYDLSPEFTLLCLQISSSVIWMGCRIFPLTLSRRVGSVQGPQSQMCTQHQLSAASVTPFLLPPGLAAPPLACVMHPQTSMVPAWHRSPVSPGLKSWVFSLLFHQPQEIISLECRLSLIFYEFFNYVSLTLFTAVQLKT